MTTDTSDFRLLHTMIRVKDAAKSIDFYSRHLGMKVLRNKDFPGGKFTNIFMGYGDETENTVLELTHNWDQEEPIPTVQVSAIWPLRCRTYTASASRWKRKALAFRGRQAP